MPNDFGQKIRELRKAKHLTQIMLASKVRLHPTYISKIENGIVIPDRRQIYALADALGASRFDLVILAGEFQNNSPDEYKEVVTGIAKIIIDEGWLTRIANELIGEGWPIHLRNSEKDRSQYPQNNKTNHRRHLTRSEIDRIADKVRDELDFASDRLTEKDLELFAYRLGLRTKQTRIASSNPDSELLGRFSPRTKTIELNSANRSSLERKRFTIAHEIGHAVIHTTDMLSGTSADSHCPGCEAEANAFAGALLMPAGAVKALVEARKDEDRNVVFDPLFRYALSKHFGVSVSAMEIRLIELGLITRNQLKKTYMPVSERRKLLQRNARYPELSV